MFNYYIETLKKYATFSGRARRKEYWFFALVTMLVAIPIAIIDVISGLSGILSAVYTLGMVIPSIAVTVRRLHDINLSGWWYLICFVPFGGIVMFIFTVMDSKDEGNKYGKSPKTIDQIVA
ncbi:MAG: DUF805 domain-containing protein [Clostridium sp.]